MTDEPAPVPFMTHRLAVQAAALQAFMPDAEVIMRAAAIGNAIGSVGRLFSMAASDDQSATGQRDRLCLWIIVASYLKEAVVIMNGRFDGLAWKLAAAGIEAGVKLPPTTSLGFPIHQEL